ncbi:hypothetical protein GHT09_018759 [Marmota monax]|uniref:Uncharacterized protein n=1 Tax=Marmota monax TaxID=9995 RepID=A0A834UIZ8_MARMO|nr:hypothetical protein GHT09_018759 [Marmota monax]
MELALRGQKPSFEDEAREVPPGETQQRFQPQPCRGQASSPSLLVCARPHGPLLWVSAGCPSCLRSTFWWLLQKPCCAHFLPMGPQAPWAGSLRTLRPPAWQGPSPSTLQLQGRWPEAKALSGSCPVPASSQAPEAQGLLSTRLFWAGDWPPRLMPLWQASTGVLGLHGTGRTAHRRLGSPHLDRDLQVVSPTPLLLP